MAQIIQENQRLKQETQVLREENALLREQIAMQQQQIARLQEQVAELQEPLKQNSQNSNWPPSRDKSRSQRQQHSLRKKSGKRAGGQAGHSGHTLEFNDAPQHIEVQRPGCCPQCQSELPADQPVLATARRQVFDIPPLKLVVTEHRAETLVCPGCGARVSGEFPAGVTQSTQYGPVIHQMAVYLKREQLLPYARSRQLFADVLGVTLSPGPLENSFRRGAQQAEPIVEHIHRAITSSQYAHFDESGFYINGQRYWLHSSSTHTLTYYAPHSKRGCQAMDDIAILPNFTGTAIHDGLPAYQRYPHSQHALCNVHHLRELNGLLENTPQNWLSHFKRLLLACKHLVAQARAAGLSALPPPKIEQIQRLYAHIIEDALRVNSPPAEGWPRGKRGRPRKPKALNLAERLALHQRAVLAFVYDFNVPFDNNQAERDIRMLKVQQKISGCFRSWQGAADFCTIRSYTSTMRQQGFSVWQAIGSLFSSDPLLPRFTPV